MAKKKNSFERSDCPVAVGLDLLGDKWTLLVVRDLFLGAHRFGDFLQSPENMRTNILTERLKRLEAHGVIEKIAYQQNPLRYDYRLTDKGKALGPVIKKLIGWANEFYPGTRRPLDKFPRRKSNST